MPKLHKNVLTKEQTKLFPLLNKFKNSFYLVGGTAIALYIGHRESIDFDLFSYNQFENLKVRNKISSDHSIERVFIDKNDEYTVLVDGVKVTFLYYPFGIQHNNSLEDIIELPSLLTLAAMKAYALGRRAKWKDYVDMYFIMKEHHSLEEITKKAKDIFKDEFNEKIFRSQLAYFNDIDYSEKVIFKKGFDISDDKIKEELKNISLQ